MPDWIRYFFEHIGAVAILVTAISGGVVTAHVVGSNASRGYLLAQSNEVRIVAVETWQENHDQSPWKAQAERNIERNSSAIAANKDQLNHLEKEIFKGNVVMGLVAQQLGVTITEELRPEKYED